jgi:recombinational DNA repair protein (RecF pathway)
MAFVLQALREEGLLPDFKKCNRSRERLKEGYLLCTGQYPEFINQKSLKKAEYALHYISEKDLNLLLVLLNESLDRIRFYSFDKKAIKHLLFLVKILTESTLDWRPRTFGKILKTYQEISENEK